MVESGPADRRVPTDGRPSFEQRSDGGEASESRRLDGDDVDASAAEPMTVTVGTLGDGFYVADDGVGIPPDDRDRVFDPGYSTREDGTGFGLAIVRSIADAHGWSVAVTESPDDGACFEFVGVATSDAEAGPATNALGEGSLDDHP